MGIHINLDLTFQPLKILQGQIIVDFFIEHGIGFGDENNYLMRTPHGNFISVNPVAKRAKVLVCHYFSQ